MEYEDNPTQMGGRPREHFCPITSEIMRDPVVASDGFSYEREAIQHWFDSHNRSPMTNAVLDDLSLRPNFALRSTIDDWDNTPIFNPNEYLRPSENYDEGSCWGSSGPCGGSCS